MITTAWLICTIDLSMTPPFEGIEADESWLRKSLASMRESPIGDNDMTLVRHAKVVGFIIINSCAALDTIPERKITLLLELLWLGAKA